jgi:hypothetical protein
VASRIELGSQWGMVASGVISDPMTAQLLDQYGNPMVAPQDTVLTLTSSSSSGVFTDGNGNVITGITIPAGSTSATFCYQDSQVGNPTLTVTPADPTLGTAAIYMTVYVPAPSQLSLSTSTQPLATGAVSDPITVEIVDQGGKPIVATQDTVLTLGSSSSTGVFTDGSGNVIASITIPAGSNSATFCYQDTQSGWDMLTVNSGAAALGETGEIMPVGMNVAPFTLPVMVASYGAIYDPIAISFPVIYDPSLILEPGVPVGQPLQPISGAASAGDAAAAAARPMQSLTPLAGTMATPSAAASVLSQSSDQNLLSSGSNGLLS